MSRSRLHPWVVALAVSVMSLTTITAAIASAGIAADLPEPSGYLVDTASAVPDQEQQDLEAELEAYAARSGHQLAVAVVASTGTRSIEDYANDLFAKWGVGSAERDDGVLMVVATTDRRLRIEVGRGLEGTLTDIQAADIIRDDMVAPLRAGRVTDAVRAGERGVRSVLGDPEPDASSEPGAPRFSGFGGGEAAPREGGGIGLFPLLVLALVAFALLSGLGGRRRRRRRRGLFLPLFLGSGWGGGGSGFGGGGLGGGGGFGGFGGGSSGGGGASGSW
jgi:uncharacterized protein